MPTVNKQVPTLSPRSQELIRNLSPAAQKGIQDMLDGAVPASELNDFIRMSIYGGNRTGKTTLACDFPKPLLLIQFEPNKTGGGMSIRKVKGVICQRYTSSKEGLLLCKQLHETGGRIPQRFLPELAKQGIHGKEFATYVIDGVTSYQDIILQEVMGWAKLPEQLSFGMVGKERYQERAEKVKEGLRPFTDLPGHTIFLAKEKDHNPNREDYASLNKLRSSLLSESFFAEDVGGSVAGWLHDECDYIGRLYLAKEIITTRTPIKGLKGQITWNETQEETGRIVRRLRTLYHPNFAAGFRSSEPSKVPEHIDEPTYSKIQAVIDGTYVALPQPKKGA